MVNQHCPAVVFDGYPNGPSVKDTTQNWISGMHVGAIVQVSGSMFCGGRKEDFPSNKENKQRFIILLSDHLKSHGCHTEHARTYADLLIAHTAIAFANWTTKLTVLVADDTDILILLCFHTQPTSTNIYLCPEPHDGTKKALGYWSIAVLINILGPQVYNNVLFAHVILGCDTISYIYGQRKRDALKCFRSRLMYSVTQTVPKLNSRRKSNSYHIQSYVRWHTGFSQIATLPQ